MKFLKQIEPAGSSDLDADGIAELTARERARGRELRASGAMQRILPGRSGKVGIWKAWGATGLHELIGSLPAYRRMDVRVTALVQHPLDAKEAGPC